MKFIVLLCCFLIILDGVLTAGILKRDVADKAKDLEDIYGDLEETQGQVQKDDPDYYDNNDGDDDNEPEEGPPETVISNDVNIQIVSSPQTFVQELGDVVRLPCQGSSKSDHIRVWSKDTALIYQGNINVVNKKNYKLLGNGTLEIILESNEDFGNYHCKLIVSETTSPEVVHTVVQKVSPTITALFATDNKQVFDIDDSLTLTCNAEGYPTPKISWHKDGERLGTEGQNLTIMNVKSRHRGTYLCLADNNVGKPAHERIEIHVNFAPEVRVEDYMVNSDHKKDAELVCIVNAYPIPVVIWQRNGENIISNDKFKLERGHNGRHVLIIRNLTESEFGEYSCVATNSLDKQVKTVNLVKTPVVKKLNKNATNDSSKDIILQWKVESKQEISRHELQYRKKGETTWKTIFPDVGKTEENDVYLIKHTLKNLEPGIYETRARSMNSHGWSNFSEITPFEGAKHAAHHSKAKHNKKENKPQDSDSSYDTPAQHRSEDVLPVGESTSSCSSLSSSLVLVALSLFGMYHRH